MKVLASYSKPEDAHLAASFLRGNGIHATVRDEQIVNLNWLYSNAIGGVKIEVFEEDFEAARELLDLGKNEKGILSCPNCGSGNVRIRELNFLAGICLAAGFILPFTSHTVDCNECKSSFSLESAVSKTEETPDELTDR